ncbi:hypothetical protein ACO0LF_17180 [Undibacterium sp. Di27W]|uniref:hypothetical protein n=1 Tax=Undibacterium sp. Di27W TaxID=3413036 RepID=UPI003BF2712A
MANIYILVLGDNFQDQLEKYKELEYIDANSRHIVELNVLDEMKARYANRAGTEKGSFAEWTMEHSYRLLENGCKPDIESMHRQGWARVDSAGQVIEIINRTVPDGFIWWFNYTIPELKLKPGRHGMVSDGYTPKHAIEGYAGCARKGALDYQEVRKAVRTVANQRWCDAAAACGSQVWTPFEIISTKYKIAHGGRYSESEALRLWMGQAAVKAMLNMPWVHDDQLRKFSLQEQSIAHVFGNPRSHESIDKLLYSRNDYLEMFHYFSNVPHSMVIHDGVLLDYMSDEYFDSLDDDTIVTLASVHI